MRLTIPEPTIDLYKQGFEGTDKLRRNVDGKRLSKLVENISDPMVIAIDAPWGAGKTVFLKCWVGAHTLENEGTAQTVYFDSFANDYFDDPLISILEAIQNRFEKLGESEPQSVAKLKTFGSIVARSAVRIAARWVTGNLSEQIVAELGDENLGNAVGEDLNEGAIAKASALFSEATNASQEAFSNFRTALEELSATEKLVIVVDELDRCRPDYALSLLEVIKHFFNVPNVHFVLGTNLDALVDSVRARHGSSINAQKYLQKFISVTMPLRRRLSPVKGDTVEVAHLRHVAGCVDFDSVSFSWLVEEYLSVLQPTAHITLRDIERIVTKAIVAPEPPTSNSRFKDHMLVGAIFLGVLAPDVLEAARRGEMKKADFYAIFRLDADRNLSADAHDAHCVWAMVFRDRTKGLPQYLERWETNVFGKRHANEHLRDVIAEFHDQFQIEVG
ncbi:P-loop NTPase fold protein [Cognatiyoonia sp. IB215182]|uniref:KAP family P-loop NTPase fold protein n=1 Tax=Cognatiyoonia sp. IB215182 TaxID=3097353 RepID=UPI002A0E24E3|nr:P-loop NTPase fold protein [Cognatiyoonia sp. IB215182]MDX8354528.1 P-loop NTPase fold protein [Cognatiyoonia sp. IB215182]